MQCKSFTWVTRGTKMRNKNAEIKIGGTKIGGTKIWWGPMVEKKMVLALGHWVAGGTPSASAKGQRNKKWRN